MHVNTPAKLLGSCLTPGTSTEQQIVGMQISQYYSVVVMPAWCWTQL